MEFWLVFVTTLNRNASAASRVPSTFSAKTSGGVDKVRYVCYAQLCCGSVFTSFVEMNVSFLRNVQLCFPQTATVPKQGRMTSLFCTNAKCCGTLLWHIVKTMIFPTFLRIYQRTSRKASEFLFHISKTISSTLSAHSDANCCLLHTIQVIQSLFKDWLPASGELMAQPHMLTKLVWCHLAHVRVL